MTYNDREYRIKLLDRKIKEAEDQLQLDQAEYKKLLQEKNKQFDDVFSKKYNIDCTDIHKLISYKDFDIQPSSMRCDFIGGNESVAIDNPRIKALIDHGLLNYHYYWLDESGCIYPLKQDEYDDLINPNTPYYDPIKGDDASMEFVLDSLIPVYFTTGLFNSEVSEIWSLISE